MDPGTALARAERGGVTHPSMSPQGDFTPRQGRDDPR